MKTLCLLAIALISPADYVQRMINTKSEGLFEANATYVEFKSSHALAKTINSTVKQMAQRDHNAWLKQTNEALKEMGKPTAPWEHELGTDVVYNTPRLVSIVYSTYDYSGGAHPNHWSLGLNFGFVNGAPARLKAADFFQRGFASSAHISKLVIGKLKRREGADLVKDGEVKTMSPQQLQNFTVAKDGLTWYFNPYEVGPYAAGDFEVKLIIKELGPKFKRAMLLGK